MDRKNVIRSAVIGVCACVAIVSAVMLIRYAVDYFRTKKINAELVAQYHAETAAPTLTETPMPTAEPAVDWTAAPVRQTSVPAAAAPKATYDPFGGYPNNPYREVLAQFKTLQKTNPDICGWITIGSELDQAVVQRDNEYYLTRDYTGKQNKNGAIFLDEQVKLWKRPTCYILYGHNMKTQEMFGSLHKYDSLSYLREHAVITFDTQYEEGQYAVFASGTISLDPGSLGFADYYNLPDAAGEKRSAILDRIRRVSDYQIELDVSQDDQLLILVTCVGDDRERRFVAARRLRDGENEGTLHMTYLLATKK